MNGKVYVVACCGTVSQYDTMEEVQDHLDNSLSKDGEYGFLQDKVFDHYPTEAEFDAYMAEAAAYEAAYDERCRVERESHEAKNRGDELNVPELLRVFDLVSCLFE